MIIAVIIVLNIVSSVLQGQIFDDELPIVLAIVGPLAMIAFIVMKFN